MIAVHGLLISVEISGIILHTVWSYSQIESEAAVKCQPRLRP